MTILSKWAAIIITASLSLSASVYANQIQQIQLESHTWHNIVVNNSAWLATLTMISEPEFGYFIEKDDKTLITKPFQIQEEKPYTFGFNFKSGATFDIGYVVALVQKKEAITSRFTSKTCIFVVTAIGPGKPVISTLTFNGASCQWTDTGQGENFFAE